MKFFLGINDLQKVQKERQKIWRSNNFHDKKPNPNGNLGEKINLSDPLYQRKRNSTKKENLLKEMEINEIKFSKIFDF